MPNLCTLSRNHSNQCSEICGFELKDLIENRVSKTKLLVELKNHKHPQSRTICNNGHKRGATVEEMNLELIHHYSFFHEETIN